MKKQNRTLLIFAGVAVAGFLFLRSRGMLGAARHNDKYNGAVTAKAVRAGAMDLSQWLTSVSPQELAWLRNMTATARLQYYYDNYIEPWVRRNKGNRRSSHAACGQWLPPCLRCDERRGEQQGIGGEG